MGQVDPYVLNPFLRRRPLSYRNLSSDLRSKSMDWFLYDNGLLFERVKVFENGPSKICLETAFA